MKPVLYILMRDDITSLTPGKAAAQASHATSLMVRDHIVFDVSDVQANRFLVWKDQTDQYYGTVIVLGANPTEIDKKLSLARSKQLVYGWVVDPSYPMKDGYFTHAIELRTCAYILADKEDNYFLSDLELWNGNF